MRFLIVLTLLLVGMRFLRANEMPIARTTNDAFITVPELIEKYGYPAEIHHVETKDGYILEMHRIPYGIAENAGPAPNKRVVFLQHGILTSSADWVISGPKNGLGFLLADLGYDVWMGNARGNRYSRAHKTLSPNDSKFWNFSWHEIGVYDLPAMIDYTLEKSGQKQIFYIGHSQGTTTFFVMCSELPEYNSKIRAQFSLAPLAFMNHTSSPILRFIASFNRELETLLKLIGLNEFLPNPEFIAGISNKMCSDDPLTQFICSNPLFLLAGFNLETMNIEMLPFIMKHAPAGSSIKQFVHYAQLVNLVNSKFRQYDYGPLVNPLKYNGSLTPPDYDLKKVRVPVALMYSKNDQIADERDVRKLYDELPVTIGMFQVRDDKFTHFDFLWGKNVVELVYERIFILMKWIK